MSIKQVVCPNVSCKAILGVEQVDGLEKKTIRCPRCGQSYPFTAFAEYGGPKLSPRHQSPSSGDETEYSGNVDNDSTRICTSSEPAAVGGILLPDKGTCLPLRLGKNVIGREASTSTADIRVPDSLGKRTMSRAHLLIHVTRSGDTIKHQLSLFPDGKKKNRTYVNHTELHTGDVVILHDGDRITIDYQTLFFVQK